MVLEKSADLNWHHKEVILLDLKWVDKKIVVYVEMKQFGDQDHQGHAPAIALSRQSDSQKGRYTDCFGTSNRQRIGQSGPCRSVGWQDQSVESKFCWYGQMANCRLSQPHKPRQPQIISSHYKIAIE
ncbi:hypothetical protein [uncultured Cohaesibacter sp.]|uniref:hypothetical protein n=1 Tax=uncultured Cohaesibacter sp. TaxID=1002546 RepID=UPI00292D1881|nr:hypothetical protein [uncultured Cohaesibacter sp.]